MMTSFQTCTDKGIFEYCIFKKMVTIALQSTCIVDIGGRRETGQMTQTRYNITPYHTAEHRHVLLPFVLADAVDIANDCGEKRSSGCVRFCKQDPHMDERGIQGAWRHRYNNHAVVLLLGGMLIQGGSFFSGGMGIGMTTKKVLTHPEFLKDPQACAREVWEASK